MRYMLEYPYLNKIEVSGSTIYNGDNESSADNQQERLGVEKMVGAVSIEGRIDEGKKEAETRPIEEVVDAIAKQLAYSSEGGDGYRVFPEESKAVVTALNLVATDLGVSQAVQARAKELQLQKKGK